MSVPHRGLRGPLGTRRQGIGSLFGRRTTDNTHTEALEILKRRFAGSATETPDPFPGYYAFHFTRDGQISGMLSVNAFTGAVWYHAWHGAFVASTEA